MALWEAKRDVRVGSIFIGKRRALHAGSSGKVLLAFGSEDIREAILSSELHRFTPNTIVQRGRLAQELGRVHSQGYAMSNAEVAEDIRSVAAPVRDAKGKLVASLGMSVPMMRATDAEMQRGAEAVVAAANALSRDLGWSPPVS